jgi:N-methylhydantoinase B
MTRKQLDGARLAIMSNRFEGIARKMANTLFRTGRSGVLNRARDFSCCIVTADCELLAAADSLPIHVLAGPDQMAAAMHQFHPVLKRGDAFLHNSPYHGCSHPADHTILVPVIDDQGTHHFTVVTKAHQADIGNSVPTTYHGAAKDVYEEGALIFPCVQVEREYETIDDIVRMCEMRIRVPEQWKGDFLAMLGSARIGEREVLALADELGWDSLHEFADQWFDYSERRMMAAIGELPAGKVISTSTHDHFPGTPVEGITISATVTVDPQDAVIEVDLLDNLDALPCGLNVSESCTRTSCLIGIFNSIDHTVPKNAGSFRRVKMRLKKGAVVGIPEHPSSCSVATTNLADRIAAAVQTAFAKLADGIGMAEVGAVIPPAAGVVSGIDPRTKEAFVNQLFLGFTGGAGSPKADCWVTYAHVGNGGLCYLDSIELDEIYQPIFVNARYLMQDTEGAGRYRGASSLYVEYGPVNCAVEIGYVSDGVDNTAKGVRGGGRGNGAEQYRRTVSGELESLDPCAQVTLLEGETIVSISCGGGGYGPAEERYPEKVGHDVREGWISAERAREVYKVALNEALEIDGEATRVLRAGQS